MSFKRDLLVNKNSSNFKVLDLVEVGSLYVQDEVIFIDQVSLKQNISEKCPPPPWFGVTQ